MPLPKSEVRRIARLACLAVSDEEVAAYARDLSSILDLVRQLAAVDTAGVLPMAHPLDAEQRLRDDMVTETDQRERLQRGAPRVEAGLYLVPRVVE